MYLVLKNAAARNVRANYAAASCSDKYYPKRDGREAKVNGKKVVFKITGSRNYATAATAGNNAYFQLDGKTYWISFDPGFDATKEELIFTTAEGTCEKNPVREPKDPAKETERRKNLGAALRAKFATAEVPEMPATEEGEGATEEAGETAEA